MRAIVFDPLGAMTLAALLHDVAEPVAVSYSPTLGQISG